MQEYNRLIDVIVCLICMRVVDSSFQILISLFILLLYVAELISDVWGILYGVSSCEWMVDEVSRMSCLMEYLNVIWILHSC